MSSLALPVHTVVREMFVDSWVDTSSVTARASSRSSDCDHDVHQTVLLILRAVIMMSTRPSYFFFGL